MSKIAFVFPGQGSQYVGMGQDLYEQYPAAKAVFDAADEALGFSLSELMFRGDKTELTSTVNAQPALLAMSIACLEAAREAGVLPDAAFAAGHSLGEYTALVAAGAMDFKTAVRLARERGRLMYEAGLKEKGTMAAVIGSDYDNVKAACDEAGAYVANLNCPGQIAISGTPECVKEAGKCAKARGAKIVIPLQVSGAFHSPLMKSAAEGLAEYVDAAEIHDPEFPVVCNTNAEIAHSADEIKAELKEQVCSCVKWEKSVRYMIQQGVDEFIEIGPGNVLNGLLSRIDQTVKGRCIGKAEDIKE